MVVKLEVAVESRLVEEEWWWLWVGGSRVGALGWGMWVCGREMRRGWVSAAARLRWIGL